MNTALVGSEAINLLSRITGQKLSEQDLKPSVIFLAALVTILLGIIHADGEATDAEVRRLLTTLNRFVPPDSDVRRLAHLMIKGVRENKLDTKSNELQTLTAPLSEPEKLLLSSFAYEMSAANDEKDAREQKYLQIISNRLGINPQYVAVLEAEFYGKGTIETAALEEVESLLNPTQFEFIDPLFVNAANSILANLSAKHKSKMKQTFMDYSLELQQSAIQLKEIVQTGFNELNQAEKVFDDKRRIADLPLQEILEQLGECSGRYVKSRNLAEKLKAQALEQASASWQKWNKDLEQFLKKKGSSNTEKEEQNPEVQKWLAREYAKQFTLDLKIELDNWLNKILKKNLEVINQDLEATQSNFNLL